MLPAALLIACMSPVEAETLRYDEDTSPHHDGRILAIPDGVREPPRKPEITKPKLTESEVAEPEGVRKSDLPASRTTRFRMIVDGTDDTVISVRGEGFPAIDPTNQLVAISQEGWSETRDLSVSATLRIVSLGDRGIADEMTTILPVPDPDAFGEPVPRSLRKQVRRDVQLANDALAARGFRPMEALPIQYGIEDAEDVYLETPAHERPLQVIARNGWLITRIPGVKVYERHVITGNPDSLYEVHADRETGTVVFTFARCDDESCMCDPLFVAQVEQWSDETFAALAAHPCPDPDECRGADYGF